jgi:hypothetical protein
MKLSQHDLQQLDEGILQGLPEAVSVVVKEDVASLRLRFV